MLEEWAWDHAVLATFATDESGEPIPAALVERMRTADEFGKGFLARTQMFYAAVSYRFHADVPDDLTATVRELQERYDLFGYVARHPLPRVVRPPRRLHLGLLHLHVVAGDRQGPVLRLRPRRPVRRRGGAPLPRPGAGPGGSADAADLVADFLGRPYGFDAFEAWLSA